MRSLTEDEEHLLTFYAFPQSMHRHIQTTNTIENLFSNVKQRTDQIDVFTTENSCLTIVWVTILAIQGERGFGKAQYVPVWLRLLERARE